MAPNFSSSAVGFNSVYASRGFVYCVGSRSVLNLLGLPIVRHQGLVLYFAFETIFRRSVYLNILNGLLVDIVHVLQHILLLLLLLFQIWAKLHYGLWSHISALFTVYIADNMTQLTTIKQ